MNGVHIEGIGAAAALLTVGSVCVTLWWMLHPPRTRAETVARAAEQTMRARLGSVVVVFSSDIASEPMMVLAARLARGQNTDLLAIYIIEVPFTLPTNAVMEEEDRRALDILASAEAIAKRVGLDVRTEVVHHRQIAQAVLDIGKRERASLIVMGSYREGKYTGAPLGHDIERIAAEAKCDVLIGVEGKHGILLMDETAAASGTPSVEPNIKA